MQSKSLLSTLVFAASALAFTIRHDAKYDDASTSMSTGACSSVLSSKYSTFGDVPKFPFIGGAAMVQGTKETWCGTCWNLTTTEGSTIFVAAIDEAEEGFVVSNQAFDELTGGQSGSVDSVKTWLLQVPPSECGM